MYDRVNKIEATPNSTLAPSAEKYNRTIRNHVRFWAAETSLAEIYWNAVGVGYKARAVLVQACVLTTTLLLPE